MKKDNYFIYKSYAICLLILLFNSFLKNGNILLFEIDVFLYAILGCFIILLLHRLIKNKLFAYLLFFSCSLTMIFNLGNPMTGMPSEISFSFLFGLSFYSLSLGYKIYISDKLKLKDIFIASNPLIIFTGPIAIFFNDISISSLSRRITFFFPYLILGIFFYQIIGTPLTNFFYLFDSLDTFSVITYGIVFELFIYFNFAGLSLIVYALLGIIGVGIPLNFRQPFSSRNLIEFWRGWHITLSSVLKQLFYTPFRAKFNGSILLFFVFISSALWHGITFNFLLWGTFHATCFIITKFLLRNKYFNTSTFLMFIGIIFGRILFVESDIERLLIKLSFNDININYSIFSNIDITSMLSLILGLLIVLSEFIFKDYLYYKQKNYKIFRIPMFQILLIILIILLINSSNGLNFAAYGQR
tara:strand:+ start:237 stop:1478 length:1242 start_codon:yes stop_codon:yes gene_type:complete